MARKTCKGVGTQKMGKIQTYNPKDSDTIDVGPGLVFSILFGIVAILLLLSSVYTISAGERGVLLTWGKPDMIAVTEGLHFKVPVAQKVVKMEVRTQKIETTAASASNDLQEVQTTIALNFHLMPESVPKLYQEVGKSYVERIINPAIQESVKSVTAQFTAEELITRRPEVRMGIQEAINQRLGKYYIQVDDFNIVNFQFSQSFNDAIEQKVTAEQLKLKADRDLERIVVEKDQKITQAQAEAESLRIQAESLKASKDVLELRWIEKWDGVMPTTYITDGGGDTSLLLGINK